MDICAYSNNDVLRRETMVLYLVLNIESYVSNSIKNISYGMHTRISVCMEGAKSTVNSPCSR